MSLTGMLKGNTNECIKLKEIISSVDINIDSEVNKVLNSEIKAKYILKDHSLAGQVGTAFDYLARFLIKHYQNKVKGISYEETYVAEYGLKILLTYTKKENNNYKAVYNEGLNIISEFINSDYDDLLFRRVVGVSVYFAKLERMFRNGYSLEVEESLRYKINPLVEKELYNQIEIFKNTFEEKFNIKTRKNNVYYNPNFDYCSVAVGGADADIVINDTLIDFKSSKYLKSIDDDFKQIIGYYLFSKIVESPKGINKICLYFSRYGEFVEYEFKEEDKAMVEEAVAEMEEFIGNILIRSLM